MLSRKDTDGFDKGSGELNTIVGKGSIIEGDVKVQNSLRVDGRIKGQIATTDSLVIGKEGEIEGEIRAKNVIVGGRIVGNIFASGKVVLEPKSTIQGEIKTSRIVIDEGATFDGTCTMSEDGKILALPKGEDGKSRSASARSQQQAKVDH